jgi:hypothetical protein
MAGTARQHYELVMHFDAFGVLDRAHYCLA